MVVTLHVLGHGGVLESVGQDSVKYAVVLSFETVSFCAVNCYALISGYVGVFSKYKVSNYVILWFRVAYYSIILTMLSLIISPSSVGKGSLAFSFLPVISERYWYFTSYTVLFIFIPILNAALKLLDKTRMRAILFILIALFSCSTIIQKILSEDVFSLKNGYSAWWLIVLYLIGGCIRKYGLLKRLKTITLLFCFICSTAITWASKLVFPIVSQQLLGKVYFDDVLLSYTSITVLLSSVFLLLIFERIRITALSKKIITLLSPLAFSVYLIHEHFFIKEYCIIDKFAWIANLPVYLILLVIIGAVLLVYFACSAIDIIRHYLFRLLKLKEKLDVLEIRIRKRLL